MPVNKRPSFVNFPIPFDHPYTIPTLLTMLGASAFLYYSLQASHKADLKEAIRQQVIYKRRHLKRKEDKFASLKIENKFVNPFLEWQEETSILESIFFYLGLDNKNNVPKLQQELENMLPVIKTNLDRIRSEEGQSSTTFTWLGQSTCLFTLQGLKILTDPIFDHKKRLRPSPCQVEELKGLVDIVLISHHHFDHLDEKVVIELGNDVTWYIPLGLREWFLKRGVENVVELDWWQEIHHKGRPDILIACVPTMHSSNSSSRLLDRDESLWCSFVIKSKSDRIFFCGDTGYVPELFQSIRDLYAPFTVAAIPIGSYEPQSMFKSLYMNPEQAIKAHKDLGSPTYSVGIHWGTFMTSNECYISPAQQLRVLWDKEKDKNENTRFVTVDLGQSLFIS